MKRFIPSTPVKTVNFEYNDKTTLVIDAMAASIVPLFYAADQNEELLRTFLKKHAQESKDNEKHVNNYHVVCEKFYKLLNERQPNPSEINEHAVFIEEVMLFCTSLPEGLYNISDYFQSRDDVVDFFFEHREVFHEIAEAWTKYVLYLPIKDHPLPMYLCPFNASEEQFSHKVQYKNITVTEDGYHMEKTWQRTDNAYNEHSTHAKKEGLPVLIARMLQIQKLLSNYKPLVQEYIQLTFPFRRLTAPVENTVRRGNLTVINQQTFFQPRIVRRPSDSSSESEESSGRRTDSQKMFGSRITDNNEDIRAAVTVKVGAL